MFKKGNVNSVDGEWYEPRIVESNMQEHFMEVNLLKMRNKLRTVSTILFQYQLLLDLRHIIPSPFPVIGVNRQLRNNTRCPENKWKQRFESLFDAVNFKNAVSATNPNLTVTDSDV